MKLFIEKTQGAGAESADVVCAVNGCIEIVAELSTQFQVKA